METYYNFFSSIWEEAVKYLGTFSAGLLVERVILELSIKYPEAKLIGWSEKGFELSDFQKALEANPDFPLSDFLSEFFEVFTEILTKLIGENNVREFKKSISL